MQTVSINGQLCEPHEATIPVNDHGLLYGDGVFEGLRFYKNRLLKMRAHMKRLGQSAKAINLSLPMTLEQITQSTRDLVDASPYENGYIRLMITRGSGPLGIDPRSCEPGRVILIADQLSMVSEAVRERGAKLMISSVRRTNGDQLDSRIKSLNYLNQIMGRMEANAADADEAIVLNQQGFVAEGTADNIFIVKDQVLLTPKVTDGALDGITRGIVIELATQLSIEVSEQSLTMYDLYNADECFLTGTGAELIPVRLIAGREIRYSPGPVYGSIRQAFQEALQGEHLFD